MPKFKIQAPDGRTYTVEAESESRAVSGLRATLDAQKGRKKDTFTDIAGRSMSLGVQDLTNAGTGALMSQLPRVIGKDPGYGLGEAFQAARRVEKQRADEYAQEKPVRNLGAGVLGGLAMPGGAQIAKAGAPIAKGLLGGLEAVGRGAGIGAAMGGAFGGITEPDDALGGAKRGALTGLAAGGALPAIASTSSTLLRPVLRAANKATEGKLLSVEREVSTRLGKALRDDGYTLERVRDVMNSWMKNGVTPKLLDIVGANSRTGAVLKGAAGAGAGRKIAGDYTKGVRGNLQDNALDLTRNLTPGRTRSATQVGEDLDKSIRASDNELYPKFREDRVPSSDVGTSLSGDTGLRALRQARDLADARQDWDAVNEIDRLIEVRNDPEAVRGVRAPETVSAGTLDLIRRGLRDAGQSAFEGGQNTLGGGLKERAGALKDTLLGVDGFREATEASTALRGRKEALELGGQGRSMAPDEFQARVGEITDPDAIEALRIGHRSRLANDIGAPVEDSTALVNRLSTARNQGRNLATSFGPEAAETYQGGLGNLTEQISNAKAITPRDVPAEEGLGDPVPLGMWATIASVANKLRNGATLTDAERESILRSGLGDLDLDSLDEILRHKLQPRSGPAIGYGINQTLTQSQGN